MKTVRRSAAVELAPDEFRKIGHAVVEELAAFLESLPSRPVTTGETPAQVRDALDSSRSLPNTGTDPMSVTRHALKLLLEHSLFNGHPRFFGYVTSSATPLGAIGDFIASAINANVGAWNLGPAATEMEAQTIRWIAGFIGYPADTGGLLVSGGNMANFIGFLSARAHADRSVRSAGVRSLPPLRCYCSTETHTWVQKAADISGLGTDSVRWVRCDAGQMMDIAALRQAVEQDRRAGDRPFLVIGTAGTVSTGAVDPLPELAAFCRDQAVWFHVDGAYGGLAAGVPGTPEALKGIALADSVAVDPHKWLYAPLESGCALVRRPQYLTDAFSYRPPYYAFDKNAINYFDLGPQNSRGFRALKIWMAFQQAGREGFLATIAEDISLARSAFELFRTHADFEAVTCGLSVCTFRYVPGSLRSGIGSGETEAVLNRLNEKLLEEINRSGAAFLSNAVVDGRFLLRMCIVNFRTSQEDIQSLPLIFARAGAATFAGMMGTDVTAR